MPTRVVCVRYPGLLLVSSHGAYRLHPPAWGGTSACLPRLTCQNNLGRQADYVALERAVTGGHYVHEVQYIGVFDLGDDTTYPDGGGSIAVQAGLELALVFTSGTEQVADRHKRVTVGPSPKGQRTSDT